MSKNQTLNEMGLFSRLSNLNLQVKTSFLLISLFFIYGLGIHFFDGVMPIHAWRKSDTLSFAWNYYQGSSFFAPETNHISYYGNRNGAAEFPIIYYLVGILWKLFGLHEWIAKAVSFSTLFISLILFSNVVNHFMKNQLKSMVFIGVIFSSPILLIYSDTLLPNIFSFAFVLIAAYFLHAHIILKKKWGLGFFALFVTLAILIKVTALIVLLTFAGGATFYYYFQEKSLFSKHLKLFYILGGIGIASLILTFAWYSYAISYNSQFKSTLFSTEIRPIWEVDAKRQKEIWEIILKYRFCSLYNYWALIPTFFLVLKFAIQKKISSFFFWLIGIGFVGITIYLLLWFWVFDVHDYYLIEILFFPLIFFFIAIKSIQINSHRLIKYFTFGIIVLVFLHAISYTQIAFGENNFITRNTFLVSQFVKANWEENLWYHGEHLKKLQNQKDEIQKIIQEKDTLFCLTDQSPNVQLYTINRIGYTSYTFVKKRPYAPQIPRFIKKGAKYLLVVGPEPLEKEYSVYTKDTIYCKNGVFIFRLKK